MIADPESTALSSSWSETIVAPPLALELSWRDGGLASIGLGYARGRTQSRELSPRGRELASALARYVSGQDPQWPDLDFDFASLPRFTAKVLQTLLQEVDHGRTVTYGQLAAMAGSPGSARAVGQALARNPWPLVVPCHRVLGSKGALTGFTNPSGTTLKRELLTLEGVSPLS